MVSWWRNRGLGVCLSFSSCFFVHFFYVETASAYIVVVMHALAVGATVVLLLCGDALLWDACVLPRPSRVGEVATPLGRASRCGRRSCAAALYPSVPSECLLLLLLPPPPPPPLTLPAPATRSTGRLGGVGIAGPNRPGVGYHGATEEDGPRGSVGDGEFSRYLPSRPLSYSSATYQRLFLRPRVVGKSARRCYRSA